MTSPQLHIHPDTDTLFTAAAEHFIHHTRHSIDKRDAFHVALAGGSTPQELYRLLALPSHAVQIDWSRVHIYFGDERCVPPDHSQSNFRMAQETLLDRIAIDSEHVHRIRGELPPPQAASEYDALLRASPPFDLVLLGMGDDGHTASLFPSTEVLEEQHTLAKEVYVEKMESWRITLTYPVFNHAREIMVLVSGAQKADTVATALTDTSRTTPLPIQRLNPTAPIQWFLDQPAAHLLEKVL